MGVILATILKNQEKYSFVNEFQDNDKSCILQAKLHGSTGDNFSIGDKLSLILNSGHDFHMKPRGNGDKVHVEEVEDSPD